MFDTKIPGYLASASYNDILNETFGVHTSLTAGIPAHRFVYLNTEASTAGGEAITDNVTVGFAGTAGSVATACVGITKVGTDNYSDLSFIPGANKDFNVTATTLGVQIVEVAPSITITVGQALQSDAAGKAVITGGTATGFVARTAATGTGTLANPEYVAVLVK